jgi:4-hydroxy-tetrahydrodipicolinate reductase
VSSASAVKIRLAVVGALGRMGCRVMALAQERPRLVVVSALERPGVASSLPQAAGVRVTEDALQAVSAADVVVDFSAPAATGELAPLCAERGVSYLVASTGLGELERAALEAAARHTAVLQAANLSLGVNVLLELVETAAKKLGGAFEVEVSEIHHRYKRDAPSGTALALGKAVERGRGDLRSVVARHGVGEPRANDELGFASLRGGDVAGEHTVFFFGDGERLELTHRATTADIFARGALVAAEWLAGKPAGLYVMRDVFGA